MSDYSAAREEIHARLTGLLKERDDLNDLISGYRKALNALEPPMYSGGGYVSDITLTDVDPATVSLLMGDFTARTPSWLVKDTD